MSHVCLSVLCTSRPIYELSDSFYSLIGVSSKVSCLIINMKNFTLKIPNSGSQI